jgi:hypothetical protein
MKITGDRNQCRSCGEFFNSVFAFEKHRTGDFGINRRCMTEAEMRVIRMDKNHAQFWVSSRMPDSVRAA